MSIAPNKYIPLDYSILGISAIISDAIKPNDTVSTLWDRLSKDSKVRTFDRFAAALTLLYTIGLISVESGVIKTLSKKVAK